MMFLFSFCWFWTYYLIHRNSSHGNSQSHKRWSPLSHHQDGIVFLSLCWAIPSSSISQLFMFISSYSSFEVRHIITNMFGILTEKSIRKEINFFMASVSFDPFELMFPFSNLKLLIASRENGFVSLSEFIVNRTVT